jgi:hypothetical protein
MQAQADVRLFSWIPIRVTVARLGRARPRAVVYALSVAAERIGPPERRMLSAPP